MSVFLQRFFGSRQPNNTCDVCSSSFESKGDLKRHIVSVPERKNPFKCDICCSAFSQKINLKAHVSSVHEGKMPFKCDICGSGFPLKYLFFIEVSKFLVKHFHT